MIIFFLDVICIGLVRNNQAGSKIKYIQIKKYGVDTVLIFGINIWYLPKWYLMYGLRKHSNVVSSWWLQLCSKYCKNILLFIWLLEVLKTKYISVLFEYYYSNYVFRFIYYELSIVSFLCTSFKKIKKLILLR